MRTTLAVALAGAAAVSAAHADIITVTSVHQHIEADVEFDSPEMYAYFVDEGPRYQESNALTTTTTLTTAFTEHGYMETAPGEYVDFARATAAGEAVYTREENLIGLSAINEGRISGEVGFNRARSVSTSVIDVTFELAEATHYVMYAYAANNELNTFRLTGPGGVVYDMPTGQVADTLEGTLSAGSYRFELITTSNVQEPSLVSGTSVWAVLLIPAPASAGLLALGGLVAARRRH